MTRISNNINYSKKRVFLKFKNDCLFDLQCNVHWTGEHRTNAFPVIPNGQLHIGTCVWTSQIAFSPHVPGHGFTHLLRIQALSIGQSELKTHSGRQPMYGSPWNSGKQLHIPELHCAFDPHGEGSQGSLGAGSCAKKEPNWILFSFFFVKSLKIITWLLWCWNTVCKWISGISFEATTYWNVIINCAFCTRSTWTRTWIDAAFT